MQKQRYFIENYIDDRVSITNFFDNCILYRKMLSIIVFYVEKLVEKFTIEVFYRKLNR